MKHVRMVKSIRIGRDELHTELIKLQGRIQAEEGRVISMDDLIEILLLSFQLQELFLL